jgi:hypothetical protein
MVMGPERPGPKIDFSANYRAVLSSERVPHFRIKKFADQEKKMKRPVIDPKGGPELAE